jgi:hypothetical protein
LEGFYRVAPILEERAPWQNLALLRKLALNLAKLDPSKGSTRGKLKQAGWNNALLAQILLRFANLQCDSPGGSLGCALLNLRKGITFLQCVAAGQL